MQVWSEVGLESVGIMGIADINSRYAELKYTESNNDEDSRYLYIARGGRRSVMERMYAQMYAQYCGGLFLDSAEFEWNK